jgi:hypothetical protein
MAYLLAGPLVAIVGIVAIFFVLRRKSVEKRSMYSARRSQIEHKVRAARQRTLTPRGHAEKPAEPAPAGGSPFDQTQVQPTITYQTPAYEAPPVAPPAAPPPPKPAEPYAPMPWDTPSAPAPPPAPAPSTFDYPPAPAQPYTPAPEPTPMPAPSEPVWTPAPRPAEPMRPMEPVAPAASSTSAGAWSVVSTTKEGATAAPESKKKDKDRGGGPTSAWQLASGDAPGMEAEEAELKRPSGTLMAVAQYAILVVGLVMVLIGVLVMVANSHVT